MRPLSCPAAMSNLPQRQYRTTGRQLSAAVMYHGYLQLPPLLSAGSLMAVKCTLRVPAVCLQQVLCCTVGKFVQPTCTAATAARALEAGYGFNDTAILPSGTFSGIYSTMRYFGEPPLSADLICTPYVSCRSKGERS